LYSLRSYDIMFLGREQRLGRCQWSEWSGCAASAWRTGCGI